MSLGNCIDAKANAKWHHSTSTSTVLSLLGNYVEAIADAKRSFRHSAFASMMMQMLSGPFATQQLHRHRHSHQAMKGPTIQMSSGLSLLGNCIDINTDVEQYKCRAALTSHRRSPHPQQLPATLTTPPFTTTDVVRHHQLKC